MMHNQVVGFPGQGLQNLQGRNNPQVPIIAKDVCAI
jgi:hypothetical protein